MMLEEGTEYKFRPAGILTRTFGAVVDLYIFQFVLIAITSLVDHTIFKLLFFILYFAIVPFLIGGTFGQKLFGMSLVNEMYTKVKLWRAILRSILLLSTFWWFFTVLYHWDEYVETTSYIEIILPFVIAFLPLVIAFFNKKRQTLFDKLSGTCVVVQEKVVVTEKGEHSTKRGLLEWGRLFLKVIIAVFMGYAFYTFAVLFVVYGMMYLNHNKNYNQSFHKTYTPNDYNDSAIQFYAKELKEPSKAFVNAEGMYDIFEADVKRDLAANCISYFLRQHKEENWISLTGDFKKSARNRYAKSKEEISRTKENVTYLGRHFYDYDLNDVDSLENSIADTWGDENANSDTCQKKMPVGEMYQQFILRYIENREEALAEDKKSLKRAKPKGVPAPSFYKRKIAETQRWLDMLYAKHPEYQAYKERKMYLKKNRKKFSFWRSVKEGKVYAKGYFEGYNANEPDENGTTGLMLAAQLGTVTKIERTLMEADLDFHAKDKEGRTVYDQLKERINRGSREAQRLYNTLRVLETKRALGGKAEIASYAYDNSSDRLSIVINRGKCKDFDLPVRTKCGVLAKKKNKKWDPIFDAIYNKDNEALDRLLAEGGHENAVNSYGHSALFYSIPKNHYALKRLIESGADIYAPDKFGNSTPLMSAARQNDIESVKILLAHGMDVNYKHPRGDSVLDSIVWNCKKGKEMILYLKSKGARFLKTDERRLKRDCKDTDYYEDLKKLLI